MRAVQRDPPPPPVQLDRQAGRDITAFIQDGFETISLNLFYERARAMATNPNQADGGKQNGEAMVIVSNDAPVPD
eukprot:SAG22_NODE_17658_length_300_cov_3.079602_1_plen_74_part_10